MKNTQIISKSKEVNFADINIYVGIDVHDKNWTIAIYIGNTFFKTLSIDPFPLILSQYLENNFPNGNYYSAFEAGFCGFWIHRDLLTLGINNSIFNPGDIPHTNKDKSVKTDLSDAKKIAKALAYNSLGGIAVPSKSQEAIRSLSRARGTITKTIVEYKNRISQLMHRQGIKVDPEKLHTRWSNYYINQLKVLKFSETAVRYELDIYLGILSDLRNAVANTLRELRDLINRDIDNKKILALLSTIPGIGTISAITIITELWDINRFPNFNHLVSYVGLSPACYSSGEKERIIGLLKRHSPIVRNILIESSWVAIRKDKFLAAKYYKLVHTSNPQKAIIRIAKSLLKRIRAVWIKQEEYIFSCVPEKI